MLYTLSQSHYNLNDLEKLFSDYNEQDAIVFWQDGVLQAIKNNAFFAKFPNVFVLEEDQLARNLPQTFPCKNLAQFVHLTEQFFPHCAL